MRVPHYESELLRRCGRRLALAITSRVLLRSFSRLIAGQELLNLFPNSHRLIGEWSSGIFEVLRAVDWPDPRSSLPHRRISRADRGAAGRRLPGKTGTDSAGAWRVGSIIFRRAFREAARRMGPRWVVRIEGGTQMHTFPGECDLPAVATISCTCSVLRLS